MANKTIFNDYPDELEQAAIARMEQLGGTVLFQLTNGKKLNVPGRNPGTWENKVLYNSVYAIPSRDRVKMKRKVVEGEKVREVDTFINSAVVKQYDGDGNPDYDNFWFKAEETEGVFMLRGNSDPRERDWLIYLLTGNLVENGVNPDRDKSKAICKIIDKSADGREMMARFTVEQASFLAAMQMDEQKIREFAAAMGWNETAPLEEIQPQMIQMSKDQPEWFSKFVEGNGIEYRALLKNAITAGIVVHEPTTNEVRWANGETIAVLSKESGKDYLDKWAAWVIAHPKGQQSVNDIKGQLNKKPAKGK